MSDFQNPTPGPRQIADGSEHRARGTRTGELAVSQVQAPYAENAARGNTWTISTAVAGITVTALMVVSTASAIPLVGVYNPVGSGTNLVIHRAIAMFTTGTAVNFAWGAANAPGAQAVALTTGISNSSFVSGGHTARVFAGAQAMAGTPAFFRAWPYAIVEGATAAGQVTPSGEDRVDGEIVVGPGHFLGLFGTVTTAAGVARASLVWSEIPI